MTYPASDLNGWAGMEDEFIHDVYDAEIFMDDDQAVEIFVRSIMRLKPTEDVWVTRQRQRIPVEDMTDAHIVNTIKMLERERAQKIPTYPRLVREAVIRGLDLDRPVFSRSLRFRMRQLNERYSIPSDFITELERNIQDNMIAARKRGQKDILDKSENRGSMSL